jgi:hypothetical protein
MPARKYSNAYFELLDIVEMTKAERRELGMLLARKGPDFLPGWRVVHSRTI